MENESKKTIKIRQGIGDDALEMNVQVTQEELDKMEHIRRFSPENWEGKDLELLQEARKLLNEKPVEAPIKEPESEQAPITIKEEHKRSNIGLWWALGVILVLFIGYEAFMAYVRQQTKDIVQHSALNYTKKTISFNGVSFDYPGNWSFDKNKISEDVFMIEGSNDKGSEYVVMFLNSNDIINVENGIDATVQGFADIDEAGGNIEFSAIYDSKFNGMDILASECNYRYHGKNCFALIKGFELYGRCITVIATTHNKSDLDEEEFKMMENSFKYTSSN